MTGDSTSKCMSSQRDPSQQWPVARDFAWEIPQCFSLSGDSGLFVELMVVVDNTSFIPGSRVITRWRFGQTAICRADPVQSTLETDNKLPSSQGEHFIPA